MALETLKSVEAVGENEIIRLFGAEEHDPNLCKIDAENQLRTITWKAVSYTHLTLPTKA